jgi:hypothetical protein
MAEDFSKFLLRTEIESCAFPFRISHHHQIFTIGSCFADSVGALLKKNKFDVFVNPAGTIFNPLSIHNILDGALRNLPLRTDDFCCRDNTFYSYDFHSSVSGNSPEQLNEHIQSLTAGINEKLDAADYVFITYGTAWVYQLNSSSRLVANCHKMPAETFTRRLLSQEEIIQSFQNLTERLIKKNHGIKFILTVSPVRHTRDTLALNAVSKSVLRMACHQLIDQKNIFYFPAYEIMMDDLRDYRFYERDLIHPNALALEYIWQKIVSATMTDQTIGLMSRWNALERSLNHRPLNQSGRAYLNFLEETLRQLKKISSELNVVDEIVQLEEKLKLVR